MNYKIGDIVVDKLDETYRKIDGDDKPFRLWTIVNIHNKKDYRENHWEVSITLEDNEGSVKITHQFGIRYATPTEIALFGKNT